MNFRSATSTSFTRATTQFKEYYIEEEEEKEEKEEQEQEQEEEKDKSSGPRTFLLKFQT